MFEKLTRLHKSIFYLLIVLLPTQLGMHFWPDFAFVHGIRMDYLAPTLHITDVLIFMMALSWLFTKKITLRYHVYFVLFVVFFLCNIYFSYVPQLVVIKILTVIELAFLVWYIREEKPSYKIVLRMLFISLAYSCAISWIQFILQSSTSVLWILGERTFSLSTPGIATAIMNGKLILRPYATFPHPNVLAGFITSTLPFFMMNLSLVKRILRIPFAIFVISTLYITYSRSAWIVAVLVSVGIILNYLARKNRITALNKKFLRGIIVTCILAGTIAPLTIERMTNLFSVDTQSITRRITLNNATTSMISDHMWWGVGLSNFLVVLPDYLRIDSYQDLQPVHNIYLLFLSEWGIVGLLLGVFSLIKLIGLVKKNALPVRPEIFLSLTSLALLGLFDHYPYTIRQTQLLFALLVGIALSLPYATSQKNSKSTSS